MSGGLCSARSIRDEVSVATSVFPQSSSGSTIVGSTIDRFAYGDAQSCVIHHAAGTVSGAPTTVSVTTALQHSPDGTTWTTPSSPAPSAPTPLSAADTESVVGQDLSGYFRYIRLETTVAFTGGTSPAAIVQADLTLGGASELPAV